MSEAVRKRCPNWVASEKQLLLEVVEKHLDIVENKKTDPETQHLKSLEWVVMAAEYNNETIHCARSTENIRAQWENLKKGAKAFYKSQLNKAGGRAAKNKKYDQYYDKVLKLIDAKKGDEEASQASSSDKSVDTTDLDEPDDIPSPGINLSDQETRPTAKSPNNDPSNEDGPKTKDWGESTYQSMKTPTDKSVDVSKQASDSWASRKRPAQLTETETSLERIFKKSNEPFELQKLPIEDRIRYKKISDLDVKIKEEHLKQEKIKTWILLLDLRKQKRNFYL